MKQAIMAAMAAIVLFSLFFAWQGIDMHRQVGLEEEKFHALQEGYWNLDKATRESAETGSVLAKQLVEINKYPSELLRLKLVGVGKILTGIYALLLGILIALIMMPVRLGKMIGRNKTSSQK